MRTYFKISLIYWLIRLKKKEDIETILLLASHLMTLPLHQDGFFLLRSQKPNMITLPIH